MKPLLQMPARPLGFALRQALRLRDAWRPTLSVLMYHSVPAEPDPMRPWEPDAAAFAAEMDCVARVYRIWPLEQALDALYAGTLPPGVAAITFDDGYADNLQVAAPILAARQLHATFFQTSAHWDGSLMWNDRVIEALRRWPHAHIDLSRFGGGEKALPDLTARAQAAQFILRAIKQKAPAERLAEVAAIETRAPAPERRLMLDADGVRALRDQGFAIGGHTHSHPILARSDDAQATAEIRDNRRALAEVLGTAPTLFAYPNGVPVQDYDQRHVQMVEAAGYRYAVSTAWGGAHRDSPRYQIPRFTPWDRQALKYHARLLRTTSGTAKVA